MDLEHVCHYNESLNPVLYAKGDPTNKSVHPFTFRFFPFQSIDGVVQAHVRPLDGAVMENTVITHLVMGFNIPSGFSVWIGHPKDIVGILDGCLLDCDIMFMLESGWTHMYPLRGNLYIYRYNLALLYKLENANTETLHESDFHQ